MKNGKTMSDHIKWYMPTTDEVRDGFKGNPKKYDEAGTPVESMGQNYAVLNEMAFDRWLKEHDKRIQREALKLTDEEIKEIAVRIYTDPEDHQYLKLPTVLAQQQHRVENCGYYHKLTTAIKNAFDYLVASRERES